jgi:large subunit ribosomal protein L24
MARIKKGDTVTVLSGRDRGKSGKVLAVWPQRERALVERINLLKHFERRSQSHPAGGLIEREAPIALAKLALRCPKCQRPSRARWEVGPDGSKQRRCGRCGQAFAA